MGERGLRIISPLWWRWLEVFVCDAVAILVFAAQAFCFAGIRDVLSCFMRCPCAGRHLLFFAAAKKSRQKKAG